MKFKWQQLSDQSFTRTPSRKAQLAICWMHGLGASSSDFKDIVNFIEDQYNIGEQWFLPQAPSISVAINNNFIMPAWYNIYSTTDFTKQDLDGIKKSSKFIAQWSNKQKAPVVLIGFLQGGAIALYTGLTNNAISSVIGLSTYLPAAYTLKKQQKLNTALQVTMFHGTFDDVISSATAKASAKKINQLINQEVTFKMFPCAHSLDEEQINKIGNYLKNLTCS
jgi:phospholipase/carboxylesterase